MAHKRFCPPSHGVAGQQSLGNAGARDLPAMRGAFTPLFRPKPQISGHERVFSKGCIRQRGNTRLKGCPAMPLHPCIVPTDDAGRDEDGGEPITDGTHAISMGEVAPCGVIHDVGKHVLIRLKWSAVHLLHQRGSKRVPINLSPAREWVTQRGMLDDLILKQPLLFLPW